MAKQYRSEAARKMAEQKKAKPAPRDSKKFSGGSNPHHGGSRGQSGQQSRGKR
jgi:hypothetical protein